MTNKVGWSYQSLVFSPKSCLAAKRFAQILAGSFVPVASALAVVHAERGTIWERTTSSVPDDQNAAAVLSQVAVPHLPTQQDSSLILRSHNKKKKPSVFVRVCGSTTPTMP